MRAPISNLTTPRTSVSLLLKQNAVFLHVPKTGGTFFRQIALALRLRVLDFGHEHADMERTLHSFRYYPANAIKCSLLLRKNIDAHVRQCFKFCFVRNPYDWYASYWRFMQDHQWRDFGQNRPRNFLRLPVDNWEPNSLLLQYANPDFNRFMENVLKHEPGFLTALFNRYAPDGQIHFVGKYEQLQNDIQHVLKRLNVPTQHNLFSTIGRVNDSKTPKPLWDQVLKEEVFKTEQGVFNRFGYNSDGLNT